MGHSMGAAVALELAVTYPDRVRSVVPVSASVRPDGMHEDLTIFVEADWRLADLVGDFLDKGRQSLSVRVDLKSIAFQQIGYGFGRL